MLPAKRAAVTLRSLAIMDMVQAGGSMASATKELKQRLAQESETQIAVTGRKAGRPRTNMVLFVLEDEKLSLLPVRGSDSQWPKNVLANPRIKISVGDVEG